MNKPNLDSDNWTASNQRNSSHLSYWSAAWVLSTGLAAFGPKLIWAFEPVLSICSVIISLLVGAGMIMATKKYLSGLDELHQKIFRDAAVLTLGVGLVCGNSYELLEDIRLISFEPEISHLIILMCLTFLTAMIAGHRKYQ
ncbi:MAG: hypothetical protein ACJAQ6_002247 [Arenicella sp.]|jgi:hypothetical protein